MGKKFEEYVARLENHMIENDIKRISVPEASIYLGVSPNYARLILQALALKKNWTYNRGILIRHTDQGMR